MLGSCCLFEASAFGLSGFSAPGVLLEIARVYGCCFFLSFSVGVLIVSAIF